VGYFATILQLPSVLDVLEAECVLLSPQRHATELHLDLKL